MTGQTINVERPLHVGGHKSGKSIMDRLVEGYRRKMAEQDEQEAIKRFRRNLTTVDPWRVPRPDTSLDYFYGTMEARYPLVAEVARKGLTDPIPAPPAGNPKPCWIEGKEHWPAQCVDLPDPRALWDIPGKAMEDLRAAAGLPDDYQLWDGSGEMPIYTHPGAVPGNVYLMKSQMMNMDTPKWGLPPGDYVIEDLPNGVKARRVTEGNGWGHVSIVTEAPPYPERYARPLTDEESLAFDLAEGQEWVDQQADDRAEALAGFMAAVLDDDETEPGGGYVEPDDPRRAVLDGTFDLVALAAAVIKLLEAPDCASCDHPELAHCEDGCQPPATRCECPGYWAPDKPKPTIAGAVDAPEYLL
jgi:hypothetical protein